MTTHKTKSRDTKLSKKFTAIGFFCSRLCYFVFTLNYFGFPLSDITRAKCSEIQRESKKTVFVLQTSVTDRLTLMYSARLQWLDRFEYDVISISLVLAFFLCFSGHREWTLNTERQTSRRISLLLFSFSAHKSLCWLLWLLLWLKSA